jgi:UDP-N-acetyl-D-galactosamine dehydrogenase
VDPYYLTFKAQEIGYHPEIILAGRRINDSMGEHVVDRVVRLMTQRKIHVVDSKVLILGLSFKENCPDIRNTRVVDLVRELKRYHADVDVHDPWVHAEDAVEEYGVRMVDSLPKNYYDAIVIAVAHDQFREMGIDAIRELGKPECVDLDVKHLFPKQCTTARL